MDATPSYPWFYPSRLRQVRETLWVGCVSVCGEGQAHSNAPVLFSQLLTAVVSRSKGSPFDQLVRLRLATGAGAAAGAAVTPTTTCAKLISGETARG